MIWDVLEILVVALVCLLFGVVCFGAVEAGQQNVRDAIACTEAGGYWMELSFKLDGERVQCLVEKPIPLLTESEG